MDFGLSDEQAAFADALRGFLGSVVPLERVRTLMESERGCDAELTAALAAQGVTGILIPGAYGGSELGLLDAVVAACELGRAATPFSFHTSCVQAPLLLAGADDEELKSAWLGKMATGEAVLAVAADVAVNGGQLSGTARFVADAQIADAFLVEAGEAGSEGVFLVAADAPGVSVTSLDSVDATRRFGHVEFAGVSASDVRVVLDGDARALCERARDAARIALAADAVGAADRSLELAVEYSLTREQFGRVIGSFQAVKHMCAETVAELEPTRSLLWYAAFAWDERDDEAPYVASLIKAHATDMATTATTTCVQVFGGMGFTYECDMHIWFKRAGYDRLVLGTPSAMRTRAAKIDHARA